MWNENALSRFVSQRRFFCWKGRFFVSFSFSVFVSFSFPVFVSFSFPVFVSFNGVGANLRIEWRYAKQHGRVHTCVACGVCTVVQGTCSVLEKWQACLISAVDAGLRKAIKRDAGRNVFLCQVFILSDDTVWFESFQPRRLGTPPGKHGD